jgi:adenine-specific DNA methylase
MNLKELGFPSTRFVGSKVKLADWIWSCLEAETFESTLEAFGGTGIFSFLAKQKGKEACFNDILAYNHNVGLALIENSDTRISDDELRECLNNRKKHHYQNFIQTTFSDIYFTQEENEWLDMIVQNIDLVNDKYKRAILFSALGQACLIKRPFNLFHRKNLYLRLNDVKRSFNNKKNWDTRFEIYLQRFVDEYNKAVFSNGKNNISLGLDVFELSDNYDAVYLDPPYMSGHGVNYLELYHFLEGIVDYSSWDQKVNYSNKNRCMKQIKQISAWSRKSQITELLDKVIRKFSGSRLILSYRNDGYPSEDKLSELFKEHTGKKPRIFSIPYKYALSGKNVNELLFVSA